MVLFSFSGCFGQTNYQASEPKLLARSEQVHTVVFSGGFSCQLDIDLPILERNFCMDEPVGVGVS